MGRDRIRNERLLTLVLANTIRISYYQLENTNVECKTNTHSSFRQQPHGEVTGEKHESGDFVFEDTMETSAISPEQR